MNLSIINMLMGSGGSGNPAISGQTTFEMADLGEPNLPDLFIDYDLPAGNNVGLLVYLHGWNSGGGINGAIDPDAVAYLHSNNIGILSPGMRGRNTNVDNSTNGTEVEDWRDASALEIYDIYASIRYFIDNVCPAGKINEDKIFIYGISGGGGNALGCAVKFPDMFNLIIDWYGMGKYGTYETDPYPATTSWYTDAASFYSSAIQKAANGAPKGSVGYTAGVADHSYIARDHIRFISNLLQPLYIYHAPIDGQVRVLLSDDLEDQLIADSKTYNYYRNNIYDHDHFDLSPTYYDGVFGLQWVNDAKTLIRPSLPLTGNINVAGWYKSTTRNFEVFIHYYRKNFNQTTWSDNGRLNQGKSYAAQIAYDVTNNTYEVTPLFGHNSTGDRYFFVSVKNPSGITQWAYITQSDVITISPKTLNKKPLDLNYDWNVYFDFNDSDSYILDDQGFVSNALDLTGNNNFAFQPTRASRKAPTSGYLDNAVLQFNGTAGRLATQVDFIQYTGEFTFAIKIDPDAATVGSLNDNLFGRGTGGASLFNLTTFSGKVVVNFDTETGAFISNSTPANSDVGLQTIIVRRDASNQVRVKIKNSTNTYDYGIIGTSAGTFDLRVLGASSALTKQFNGKIYKFAAVADDIGATDADNLLNNF